MCYKNACCCGRAASFTEVLQNNGCLLVAFLFSFSFRFQTFATIEPLTLIYTPYGGFFMTTLTGVFPPSRIGRVNNKLIKIKSINVNVFQSYCHFHFKVVFLKTLCNNLI